MDGLGSVLTAVLIGLVLLVSGLKILREYERAVIFRLGRLVASRRPGVIYVIPLVERISSLHSRGGRETGRGRESSRAGRDTERA